MSTGYSIRETIAKYNYFIEEFKRIGFGHMTKEQFKDIVPKVGANGNVTNAKISFIDNFSEVLSKGDIIKYFKKQTLGKDFINFYFLIKELNLELDDAGMIIFNDELKYTDVKLEALIVWWVTEIVKTDPFLAAHAEFMEATVQESFDSTIVKKKSKKYDIYFAILQVLLEIDEDHTNAKSIIDNDNIKDALSRMNGCAIIRINVKLLLKCLSYEGKPYHGENALVTTRNKIIKVLTGSLMRNEKCRKTRIIYLFQNTVHEEIQAVKKLIEAKNVELTKIDEGTDDYYRVVRMRDGLMSSMKSKYKLLRTFDNEMVVKMFNLKHRTQKSKSAIIGFDDLIELLKCDDKAVTDSIFQFIESKGLFDDTYRFTWKGLSQIILECDTEEFMDIKKVLGAYYRNVEEYYEQFISEIVGFYEIALSDRESYDIYFKNVGNILETDTSKENAKLKIEIEELGKKNVSLNSDIKQLKLDKNNLKKTMKEMQKKINSNENRKKDLSVVLHNHEGNTDFLNAITARLACVNYDFLAAASKNTEFDKELDELKEYNSNFINKYKSYYGDHKPKEVPITFNKEEVCEEIQKFLKKNKPSTSGHVPDTDTQQSDKDELF